MRCWATDRSALPFEIRLVYGAKTQLVRIYKEASVCRASNHGYWDRNLNHFRASLQSYQSVRTKISAPDGQNFVKFCYEIYTYI